MATKIATIAPEPLLYTRQAAATMLSISVRSLDYMVASKLLAARRLGSRVLIPAGELRRIAREDHPFALAG